MTHTPATPDPSAEPTAAMSGHGPSQEYPTYCRVCYERMPCAVCALRADVERLTRERDAEEEKHAACHDELIAVEQERDALRAELAAARERLGRLERVGDEMTRRVFRLMATMETANRDSRLDAYFDAQAPFQRWREVLYEQAGPLASTTPASMLPTRCERCGEEIGNSMPLGSFCLACDVEQQRQRWAASMVVGGQGEGGAADE